MITQNYRTIFLLSVFSFGMIYATDQELIIQGIAQYQNKEYTKALEYFDRVKNKSSIVWYNIGNCRYKMQDYVLAYAHWLRALHNLFSKDFDDCVANIQTVENKLGVTGYKPWHYWLYYRPLTLLVQLLFLFFWYILLFYGMDLLRKKRYLLFLFLMSLVICACFVAIMKYRVSTVHQGIVKQTATCFAGPDEKYQVQAIVQQAQKVVVIDEQQEWLKIQTEAHKGWIKKESVSLM